jgi:hypothetical protein
MTKTTVETRNKGIVGVHSVSFFTEISYCNTTRTRPPPPPTTTMKSIVVPSTSTTTSTRISLRLFGVVVVVVVVCPLLAVAYFVLVSSTESVPEDLLLRLRLPPVKSSSSSSSRAKDRYQALCTSSAHDLGWEFAGPTTYVRQFGNKEPNLACAAAIQNVVQAGGDDDTWFISSVNGGIWKSTNLQDAAAATVVNNNNNTSNAKVHWEPVLDDQAGVTCTSIAALHVSASNPNTVYAGCGGSTSGEQGYDWNVVNSGDWNGVMMSTNLGATWSMLQGFPENYYVTAILEIQKDDDDDSADSNTTILLVAAQSHLWDKDKGGIWRSTNGGLTFEQVSTTPTFTLLPVQNSKYYSSPPFLWSQNATTAAAPPADKNDHGDHDISDNAQAAAHAVILATHAHSSTRTASFSIDHGATFVEMVLPWDTGAVPFYTCSAQLASGKVVIAGLTRLGSNRGDNTSSQIFVLDGHPNKNNHTMDTSTTLKWFELQQPRSMDDDGMPKDRMALLADPVYGDLLYVAGNGGALAWRVNVTTGIWTKMWDEPDVVDGSVPHGDCRNFAWDQASERLLLVTDGGIFARIQPREPGGRWISLNGDYSALELLSAHYDAQDGRYVLGAQDNFAIVTKPHATPTDVGFGFVGGDGTVTMVDSQAKPHSRLFGTTQFLGVGTIENDPKRTAAKVATKNKDDNDDDDGDEDRCRGLCFAQGDKFIPIEMYKYFPEPSTFPFFVHPYTLNVQDPTLMHFWTNASTASHRPSAFYEFSIPYTIQDKDDIGAPTKLLETPPGAMIMDFVSGGYTNGTADPNLLIGISNTHIYVRSLVDQGPDNGMIARPLPMNFAAPVTLEYDDANSGARILGPLTHAKTVFMSVSPSDSRFVAVTGWPSVKDNLGDEAIFVTMDAGQTWRNVTGDLREASGVAGKVRPGGLLIVDLPSSKDCCRNATTRALLAGTSNGILTTFISSSHGAEHSIRRQDGKHQQQWTRLGTCKEFPIVLVAGIDYEPISDRLVAATYGRGIYILKDAKHKLLDAFAIGQVETVGRETSTSST